MICGICRGEEAVRVYQIDNPTENGAHWECTIKSQIAVPEPDAGMLTRALTKVGQEPPGLLDILNLRCGVEIGSKVYVVTVLYHRGVEVHQATLADGKMRLKGESKVLGELPEITKILKGYVYKMLDQDAAGKKKQEAEQGGAGQATNRRESKSVVDDKPQPDSNVAPR